ncbi:MAG: hypothetical protein GTO45_17200 [Candidatus Aminicenantes bacterium]|nr:hypothetical protein [Candidatus Aminicenantes bacterium]NIM80513.1 hypothetical protein [Candidatus Aminicenantes bacterium]NIN19869.1 hypothetical protein [Candidatus Aminicenantes bacterium]NIN43745.1 hypothetical protein [Candidatus Aminicenantes bacterium]NIN86495.1 hypothetical protein [Candidatus Aminicenantes bacterium]
MSQINITCQANTQKRWGRVFSVMVFGLFLLIGFNVYGENPSQIEIDQDGNWDEIEFEKFTKGDVLKVIINIKDGLVLRNIEELNKKREKAKLPLLPRCLSNYAGELDETNRAIHICLLDPNQKPGEKVISYYFVAENQAKDRTISTVPVFKGGYFKKDLRILDFPEVIDPQWPRFGRIEIEFKFTESGKKYAASIKRYSTIDDKLKQTNAYKIFTMDFFTYHRFKFGLHAGLFFPFSRFNTFGLNFENTSVENDQKAIVAAGTYWEPKVIFFVSFYPGFEPERKPFGKKAGGRFSFNIGTELSSAIFKKIYLGLGYSFNYFSVSFFCSYGKEEVLAEGYQDKTVIENPNITAVPLAKKADPRLGLVISFPIDIATGLLGKILGI